jgi:fibronectin type 3 domain-containing protein
MKRLLETLCLAIFVCLSTSWSCAQNGPTQPSAQLSWTQSTTPGITSNHVYRCTQTGSTACVPAPPSIFDSTAAITSYTDSTVQASATYVYAVTASVGTTESPYSNAATAVIPASPNAPSKLAVPVETGDAKPPAGIDDKVPGGLVARVAWAQPQQ